MRTIKFRAWYKQESKMYEVVGTYFNLVILTPSQNTIGGIEIDKLELMQFTGLKDKHGKEIYEGDVVGSREDPNYRGAVCFGTVSMPINGGEYQFQMTGFYVDTPLDATREFVTEEMSCGDVEIIGNVYANPELLKEQS